VLAVVGRRKAAAVFEGPRKVVLGVEAQPESDFLCGKRLEFQWLFRFLEHKRLLEIRDGLFKSPGPASTLIIVSGFSREEFLVEIEVVAAATD